MPDDNKININFTGGFKLPEEYYVARQDNTRVIINFKKRLNTIKLILIKLYKKH